MIVWSSDGGSSVLVGGESVVGVVLGSADVSTTMGAGEGGGVGIKTKSVLAT